MLKMKLHPKLVIERVSPTVMVIRWSITQQQFVTHNPAYFDAIEALLETEMTEAEFVARAGEESVGLYYAINQLHQVCLLWYRLYDDQTPLATFQPYNPRFAPRKTALADDLQLSLSRFALCRRLRGETVLESPLATAQIRVHQPDLLAPLWEESLTISDYVAALPNISPEIARQFFGMLYHSGFLTEPEAEDQDPRLYQWTFHDLLFHQHSRVGQYPILTGEARNYPPHIASLPPFLPPMSETAISLPTPDMEVLRGRDCPFIEVVEKRVSTRHYNDEAPIRFEALSELLYRVARAKSEMDSPSKLPYATSKRTYGSGGTCYELEIYVAVRLCDGLEAGLYHYRPLDHALEYLRPMDKTLFILFEQARYALLEPPTQPQIHLTLTARFQRTSWKYDPIAYALTLKNAGVLLHHLALTASAMNLGFAPMGSGHTETFMALLPNPDPLVEAPVAEAAMGAI